MVVNISQRAQIPVPGGGGGGDGVRTDGGMRQVVVVVCRDSRCACTHMQIKACRGRKECECVLAHAYMQRWDVCASEPQVRTADARSRSGEEDREAGLRVLNTTGTFFLHRCERHLKKKKKL